MAVAEEDPSFRPQALADRPEVPAHLGFYLSAFWALSGDRSAGWSLGPIPFTALDVYARRYGVAGIDAFDRFHLLIGRMDAEYLRQQTAD